jgi:hypothetical protein
VQNVEQRLRMLRQEREQSQIGIEELKPRVNLLKSLRMMIRNSRFIFSKKGVHKMHIDPITGCPVLDLFEAIPPESFKEIIIEMDNDDRAREKELQNLSLNDLHKLMCFGYQDEAIELPNGEIIEAGDIELVKKRKLRVEVRSTFKESRESYLFVGTIRMEGVYYHAIIKCWIVEYAGSFYEPPGTDGETNIIWLQKRGETRVRIIEDSETI